LRNRHWDGTSFLKGENLYGNARADTLTAANRNGTSGFNENGGGNGNLSDTIFTSGRYAALASGGSECIGSPVYFFFSLNSAHLTDASQMLNLDELARVAKKYGLSVRVTGAADNSTGTTDINDSLSVSRAAYIATELEHRGIPTDCITQASKGGIADYVPIEANRHTKVELLLKKSGAVSE
jgi:putative outer membrane protein